MFGAVRGLGRDAARRVAGRVTRWAVAGLCAAAAACASSPEAKKNTKSNAKGAAARADKHYDVAVGSFHNGMFSDAKLQIDRALQEDPSHPDSHYLQGVLLLNEGKSIVDAIEIQQCLTDEASQRQRERAEELHRDAGDAFKLAAEAYPEGASGRGRAFNSMSVVSLYFHDTAAALGAAEEALAEQFYTARYSALANLGWAQYLDGDTVSATASLRQSVLINPAYCVGHYRLAQIYLDIGLHEQAEQHAQQVISNAQCPIQDAFRISGVAQIRLGDEPAGVETLQKCVDLAPRSCQADDCRRLLGPQTTQESAVAMH